KERRAGDTLRLCTMCGMSCTDCNKTSIGRSKPSEREWSCGSYSVTFVLACLNLNGCPNEPLHIDPRMWLQFFQFPLPQLRIHAIRQFLKFGIREPIRFRFEVQRDVQGLSHSFCHFSLHEHPFSIRGKELEVGGYRPLVRAHLREQIAKLRETLFHISGAVQQVVKCIRKTLLICRDLETIHKFRLHDPENKTSLLQNFLRNVAYLHVATVTKQTLKDFLAQLVLEYARSFYLLLPLFFVEISRVEPTTIKEPDKTFNEIIEIEWRFFRRMLHFEPGSARFAFRGGELEIGARWSLWFQFC